jgi:hypothetical protein
MTSGKYYFYSLAKDVYFTIRLLVTNRPMRMIWMGATGRIHGSG